MESTLLIQDACAMFVEQCRRKTLTITSVLTRELQFFFKYMRFKVHYWKRLMSRLNRLVKCKLMSVPRLRRLVAGLSPRRPGFDPVSVQVGFVVDKVALGQVFPRVRRFSPVYFIPPVLHYTEKAKKELIILITVLHNQSQGCGASVASAAGPFTTNKKM